MLGLFVAAAASTRRCFQGSKSAQRLRRLFDADDASNEVRRLSASVLHRQLDQSVVFAGAVVQRRRQRRLLPRLRKHEGLADAGALKCVRQLLSDLIQDHAPMLYKMYYTASYAMVRVD